MLSSANPGLVNPGLPAGQNARSRWVIVPVSHDIRTPAATECPLPTPSLSRYKSESGKSGQPRDRLVSYQSNPIPSNPNKINKINAVWKHPFAIQSRPGNPISVHPRSSVVHLLSLPISHTRKRRSQNPKIFFTHKINNLQPPTGNHPQKRLVPPVIL
jgi:hypothetical protein